MNSFPPVDRGYLRHRASQARILCPCVVVCAAVLFSADMVKAQDAAQDVAEAARQARAHKAEQAQRDSHVYTNEDLQRARIVSDDDGASVAARKPAAVAPSTTDARQPATTSAAERGTEENAGESLGEVARRYRREKAARQAEAARKDDSASPFHMERKMVPQPALGAMAPKLIVVLPRPVIEPKKNNDVSGAIAVKRDPFRRPATRMPETQRHRSVARANSVKADPPAATSARRAKSAVVAPLTVTVNADGAKRVVGESPVSSTSDRPTALVAAPKASAPSVASSNTFGVAAVAKSAAANPAASRLLPSAVAPIVPSNEKSDNIALAPRALPGTPVAMTATVTVRAGDSLWKLSRQYLGAGSRWQEWVRSNPALRDPQRIRAGTVLAMPSSATRANLEATPAGSATELVVRGGDSLWKISVARFGSGRFWTCLQTANPALRDAGLIYPGQILQIPRSCGDEGRSPRTTAP
jgi:nucleoid-associated protein YgaU